MYVKIYLLIINKNGRLSILEGDLTIATGACIFFSLCQ